MDPAFLELERKAEDLVLRMKTEAKEIDQAVKTILLLARRSGVSEIRHGPRWDRAEAVLRKHGIKVPPAWYLSWYK